MSEYVYYAKVDDKGRLYNGSFINKKVMPLQLYTNELIIDDDAIFELGDGHNYVWDGKNLIYSPVKKENNDTIPEPPANESEIALTNNNNALAVEDEQTGLEQRVSSLENSIATLVELVNSLIEQNK
jgi:hypothetical protein